MRIAVTAVVVLLVACGGAATAAQPEPPMLDPAARVRAYVADYEAWARRYPPEEAYDNPDAAYAEERKMGARHAADHTFVHDLRSSSDETPRHRRGEKILSTTPQGEDRAVVETRAVGDKWPPYFTYTLVKQRGDWRIAAIDEYSSAPDAPRDDGSLSVGRPEVALEPGHFDEPERYFATLLTDGAQTVGSHAAKLSRVPLGEVTLGSGEVAVGEVFDFGYGQGTVLARKLRPGRYPVEVVRAEFAHERTRVAALVLIVDPAKKPVTYVLADSVPDHMGARAALFDPGSLRALTPRERERFARRADLAADGHALLAYRDGVPPSLACADGNEGVRRVLWGLDAGGEPARLIVDFAVAGRNHDMVFEVPITPSTPAGPLVAGAKVTRFRKEIWLETLAGDSVELLDATTHTAIEPRRRGIDVSFFDDPFVDGRTSLIVRVHVVDAYGLPGPND